MIVGRASGGEGQEGVGGEGREVKEEVKEQEVGKGGLDAIFLAKGGDGY